MLRREIGQRDRTIAALRQKIAALEDRIQKFEGENAALKQRLKRYENAHTPPSKEGGAAGSAGSGSNDSTPEDTSAEDDSDATEGTDSDADDEDTDAGTSSAGRKDGHEAAWREYIDPDETIEVTLESCPCCGAAFAEPIEVIARTIEDIPEPAPLEITQYNLHRYECDG